MSGAIVLFLRWQGNYEIEVYMREKIIPIAEPDLSGNEKKYLVECIDSGWVSSSGPFVRKLEDRFANYLGVDYCVAVSSGTAGLHLALKVSGIGPGDEVIVPTLTFIATVNAISYVGAKPVFIDSEKVTWNLDPDKIERLITKKTKAVICVHLYGHPADMDPIMKIAKKKKILVIEDAAEAHGAEYKGKKVGTFGHISVYSLFANKVITSGEGGLVVTKSKRIAEKLKLYRDQGLTKGLREKYHYWHSVIGYNYGMSNLQAAVALAQLERIEQLIEKKRMIACWYYSYLKGVAGIKMSSEEVWAKSVYWMFCLVLSKGAKITRNKLIKYLLKRGVETRPFFYPIHTLPCYKGDSKRRFPVAEKIAKNGINLPSGVKLGKSDIKYITDRLKEVLE